MTSIPNNTPKNYIHRSKSPKEEKLLVDGIIHHIFIKYKFFLVFPFPKIAIGLLLISIGIVVSFDIKIDLFKSKE